MGAAIAQSRGAADRPEELPLTKLNLERLESGPLGLGLDPPPATP